MSTTRVVTVHCDECGDWTDGGTVSHDVRSARKAARAAGWVAPRYDGRLHDFCPHCKDRRAMWRMPQ